jgi:hypothetical protein
VHHAGDHDTVHLGGQRDRVLREAVEVVHGAVDGVQDPPYGSGGRFRGVPVLLAQHAVSGPLSGQRGDHLALDGPVGRRHDVGVGALGLHVGDRLGPGAPGGRRGLPGDPYGDLE